MLPRLYSRDRGKEREQFVIAPTEGFSVFLDQRGGL